MHRFSKSWLKKTHGIMRLILRTCKKSILKSGKFSLNWPHSLILTWHSHRTFFQILTIKSQNKSWIFTRMSRLFLRGLPRQLAAEMSQEPNTMVHSLLHFVLPLIVKILNWKCEVIWSFGPSLAVACVCFLGPLVGPKNLSKDWAARI